MSALENLSVVLLVEDAFDPTRVSADRHPVELILHSVVRHDSDQTEKQKALLSEAHKPCSLMREHGLL